MPTESQNYGGEYDLSSANGGLLGGHGVQTENHSYAHPVSGHISSYRYVMKHSPNVFVFMGKDGTAKEEGIVQSVRWILPRGFSIHAAIRCSSLLGDPILAGAGSR